MRRKPGDGLKHWHPALPKAIDGCDCPCHSTAGMVHVVPCCGAGSINGPYKRRALTPLTTTGNEGERS